MSCEWGHDDCQFEDQKCDLCFTPDQCYKAKPQRKWGMAKHAQRADGRQGSNFEYANHKRNNKVLSDAVSGMTLNSGATVLAKGDEQILGSIRIMEELKTKTAVQAPGKKTFTIQKKWLDKLHQEALAENMEFWYLKFSFFEADQNVYAIVEQDTVMSMVKTMVDDRRNIQRERSRADVENKRREFAETKLLEAQAEIALLKAQLKQTQGEYEKDPFEDALRSLKA